MKKLLVAIFFLSFVAMPVVTNAGFFDWFRIDFGGQRAQVRSSVEVKTDVYERGDRDEEIAYLQQKLTDAGFYAGKISGIMGAKTEAAVSDWQKKNQLKATGQLNEETKFSIAGIGRDDGTSRGNEVPINIKLLLGGSYNPSTGLMSTALNDLNLLPLEEPYTDLGYDFPNNNGGEEITNSSVLDVVGANAIVDWVLVEFRAGSNPMEIDSTRAALLQADGDVVGLDGVTPLSYFSGGVLNFAIIHRNHLPIVSAEAVMIDGSTSVDFTTMDLYGENPAKIVNGLQVMWPGDVNMDREVKYTGSSNDRDVILQAVGSSTPNHVVMNTYSEIDVNMDGQIKYTGANNDRDILLQTVGSTTPNAVVQAGLPEMSELIATMVSSEININSSEPGQSDLGTFEIVFDLLNNSEEDIFIPTTSQLANGAHVNGEGAEFGFRMSGSESPNIYVMASDIHCDNLCNEVPGGYSIEEGDNPQFTLTVVASPAQDAFFSMYLNSLNWTQVNTPLNAEKFYNLNLGPVSAFSTNYFFLNAN